MKRVKLVNGFAKVEVEKDVYLVCVNNNGLFDLECRDYTERYMVSYFLKENVKRISIINKISVGDEKC